MTINGAIKQIDWTKIDLSTFAAEWISTYRKWRDEGLYHEIEADGLVAIEADPDEMGWDEFLADYTGQWDISYCSGTGKLWMTWADEYIEAWYSLCREFIADQIATILGIVDIDALMHDDEVSVAACECDEPDLMELLLEAIMANCVTIDD